MKREVFKATRLHCLHFLNYRPTEITDYNATFLFCFIFNSTLKLKCNLVCMIWKKHGEMQWSSIIRPSSSYYGAVLQFAFGLYLALESMREHGSQALPFKIMRFAIQSEECFGEVNSGVRIDFIKIWHTCAKYSVLLTALLCSHLHLVIQKLIQF